MPIARRYRRSRGAILRLRWHFAAALALLCARVVQRRQRVDAIRFFLRTVFFEGQLRSHLKRLMACVRGAQAVMHRYLRHKALRIQVMMAQLDHLLKAQTKPSIGPVEDMQVRLRALFAGLSKARPKGPAPEAAPKAKKRGARFSPLLVIDRLQLGTGTPFLAKLHAIEELLSRRRSTYLRSRTVANIACPEGSEEPTAPVPWPHFRRYLLPEERTKLLAAAREHYCQKIFTFAQEVYGRVRPQAFEAALQAKLETYHAACLRREVEWLMRSPLYSEMMGLQLEAARRMSQASIASASRRSSTHVVDHVEDADTEVVEAPHCAPSPRDPDDSD